VLLVRQLPDNKTGYGAGLLLNEQGTVLTNLHVAANATALGALLYDPERTSYTRLDGGLLRYLFENEDDVVPARLLRGDPVNDLALVQLGADTHGWPILPIAATAPRVGERVLALGHPEQSVWSATAGRISGTHQRTLQHDAALNIGNSGGPLLNDRGEVIGINTLKLRGESEGVGFARPIELASGLLEGALAPSTLDLSTPSVSFNSCRAAIEAAHPDVLRCFALDPYWSVVAAAMAGVRAEERLSDAQEAALSARFTETTYLALVSEALTSSLRASDWSHLMPPDGADASPAVIDRVEQAHTTHAQRLLDCCGMKVDMGRFPNSFYELLKMGVRVEGELPIRPDRTWLWIAGRNADGSVYNYAQLMVNSAAGWQQHPAPDATDTQMLPAGWPKPAMRFEDLVEDARLSIEAALQDDPSAG